MFGVLPRHIPDSNDGLPSYRSVVSVVLPTPDRPERTRFDVSDTTDTPVTPPTPPPQTWSPLRGDTSGSLSGKDQMSTFDVQPLKRLREGCLLDNFLDVVTFLSKKGGFGTGPLDGIRGRFLSFTTDRALSRTRRGGRDPSDPAPLTRPLRVRQRYCRHRPQGLLPSTDRCQKNGSAPQNT